VTRSVSRATAQAGHSPWGASAAARRLPGRVPLRLLPRPRSRVNYASGSASPAGSPAAPTSARRTLSSTSL
jgi:hypothetical protein